MTTSRPTRYTPQSQNTKDAKPVSSVTVPAKGANSVGGFQRVGKPPVAFLGFTWDFASMREVLFDEELPRDCVFRAAGAASPSLRLAKPPPRIVASLDEPPGLEVEGTTDETGHQDPAP